VTSFLLIIFENDVNVPSKSKMQENIFLNLKTLVTRIYRQCVAGRGWGVLSCVGDPILQEFN
jgi:hypothetical protein